MGLSLKFPSAGGTASLYEGRSPDKDVKIYEDTDEDEDEENV